MVQCLVNVVGVMATHCITERVKVSNLSTSNKFIADVMDTIVVFLTIAKCNLCATVSLVANDMLTSHLLLLYKELRRLNLDQHHRRASFFAS